MNGFIDVYAYISILALCCTTNGCVCSACFQLLTSFADSKFELMPLGFHVLACLAMLVAAANIENKLVVFVCFLMFESTVGMFYPVCVALSLSLSVMPELMFLD